MLSADGLNTALPQLPHGYRFRHGTPSELQSFYAESAERWAYLAAILGLGLGVTWPAFVLSASWLRSLQQLDFTEPFGQEIRGVLSVLALAPLIIAILPMLGVVLRYVTLWCERSRLADSGFIWIVERSHQLVGITWLSPQKNELILPLLFIHPAHRNRGVGSHLLWQLLTDSRLAEYQPKGMNPLIKVVSAAHLQRFYQRFGFKRTELKSKRHARQIPLYLATKPSFSADFDNLWPTGSLIRPVRSYRERWSLYKMFWSRQRFRQSVWLLMSVCLLSLFACSVFSTGLGWIVAPLAEKITSESVLSGLQDALSSKIKLILFILPLTVVSVISFAQTLLFKVFFVKVTVGTFVLWLSLLWVVIVRHISGWRDWVVIHNHKAVGYLHIERHTHHAVLHCLHIEPAYFRYLFHAKSLIYIRNSIDLPLYVACLSQAAYFYKKLGFLAVKKNEDLPFGVKLIAQFRTQLLKLTAPNLAKLSQAVTKSES